MIDFNLYLGKDLSKELILLEKIVSTILRRENISLSMDMTAPDVEGWDSLNHVQILFTIEQELGVQFPINEIQNLNKIGDLVKLMNKYMQ